MEFKSQICTTVEQSKRLLELGLKKETADMWYLKMIKDYKGNEIPETRKNGGSLLMVLYPGQDLSNMLGYQPGLCTDL